MKDFWPFFLAVRSIITHLPLWPSFLLHLYTQVERRKDPHAPGVCGAVGGAAVPWTRCESDDAGENLACNNVLGQHDLSKIQSWQETFPSFFLISLSCEAAVIAVFKLHVGTSLLFDIQHIVLPPGMATLHCLATSPRGHCFSFFPPCSWLFRDDSYFWHEPVTVARNSRKMQMKMCNKDFG